LNEILIPTNQLKISDKSDKNINILLFLMFENNINAHILLSIPQDRINLAPIVKKESFKDEDFLTCTTNVRIKAGCSKITLEELKNL